MPLNRRMPLHQALSFIEDRTGYRAMLEQENSPEALARLENLNELMNAAREAVERGESASDFLDHAALVAQTDAIDEQAQITLMTLHNAKGLEFPVVFLAGLEEKLFPQQPFDSSANRQWKRSDGSAMSGLTRAGGSELCSLIEDEVSPT